MVGVEDTEREKYRREERQTEENKQRQGRRQRDKRQNRQEGLFRRCSNTPGLVCRLLLPRVDLMLGINTFSLSTNRQGSYGY